MKPRAYERDIAERPALINMTVTVVVLVLGLHTSGFCERLPDNGARVSLLPNSFLQTSFDCRWNTQYNIQHVKIIFKNIKQQLHLNFHNCSLVNR